VCSTWSSGVPYFGTLPKGQPLIGSGWWKICSNDALRQGVFFFQAFQLSLGAD
jgi:hypothetical protein